MTFTYYTAALVDAHGTEFHASIFWDKNRQRSLTAHICPRTGPAEVGYSVWRATGANTCGGLDQLVAKVKAKAKGMGLKVVTERETALSPST